MCSNIPCRVAFYFLGGSLTFFNLLNGIRFFIPDTGSSLMWSLLVSVKLITYGLLSPKKVKKCWMAICWASQFPRIDVLDTWCFSQSMFLTVDVLGQKVDVVVVDVIKVDVVEIVQMGWPAGKYKAVIYLWWGLRLPPFCGFWDHSILTSLNLADLWSPHLTGGSAPWPPLTSVVANL
jgi:hypothetical protein